MSLNTYLLVTLKELFDNIVLDMKKGKWHIGLTGLHNLHIAWLNFIIIWNTFCIFNNTDEISERMMLVIAREWPYKPIPSRRHLGRAVDKLTDSEKGLLQEVNLQINSMEVEEINSPPNKQSDRPLQKGSYLDSSTSAMEILPSWLTSRDLYQSCHFEMR